MPDWLPNDWPSFLWGLVVGATAFIVSGFLREAGKDLYLALKHRLFPLSPAPEPPKPPREPILVDMAFKPTLYAPGDCAWARRDTIYRKESDGYTYYLQPPSGAKVVRGTGQDESYLMVKPGAKAIQ